MGLVSVFFFIILWWILSATILLPFTVLLIFSKTVSDKWFSYIFSNYIFPNYSKKTNFRELAFQVLHDHLKDRDKKVPLEILEVGIGLGANLDYYPENSFITAMDLNESFLGYFEERKQKYPHLKIKKVLVGNAENMHAVKDESMDIVIVTGLLCSVADVQRCLSEFQRVLKPNGLYLFAEHIAYHESLWERTLQNMVAPLWSIFFGGCHLNRTTLKEIQKAGFSKITHEDFMKTKAPLLIRPHLFGVAVK